MSGMLIARLEQGITEAEKAGESDVVISLRVAKAAVEKLKHWNEFQFQVQIGTIKVDTGGWRYKDEDQSN